MRRIRLFKVSMMSRMSWSFMQGTEEQNGQIVSSGGRVLNVTATGSSLKEAKEKDLFPNDKIKFDGAFYRRDIGYKAL
jgi:phosphoribosylamine--glycine ligase